MLERKKITERPVQACAQIPAPSARCGGSDSAGLSAANSEVAAAIVQAHFNPAQSLDRAALARPNRKNLIYGTQVFSVAQSAQITRQISELFQALGVRAGERVAVIARNSPYHLLVHLACARIGAVFVPISYRLQRREFAQVLQICTPTVIIADSETLLSEQLTFAELPDQVRRGIKGILYFDDDPQAPLLQTTSLNYLGVPVQGLYAAYQKFPGKLISAVENETFFATHSVMLGQIRYPTGLAVILFTSGSVGKPKAVGLTHEQLYWGSQNFRDGFEYSTRDCELVVAPLSHIGGFNGTTLDLFSHGGTVVVMREFVPQKLLELIEQHRVTIMFGVPTIYAAILQHPDFAKYDLGSLRAPLIGGAAASKALLQRMIAAKLTPINVWGMTETSASGCCLSQENCAIALGAIGIPFPRIATRIIDPETGEDAASGRGELLVTGPSVVQEYWEDPQASTASFTDGWLRTGDLVQLDAQGFFWVIGRIKNLINTGGEKVAPEEVENVLSAYPGVAECAVAGIPDVHWGEAIAAAFVMQEGEPLPSVAQLREFTKGKLASYKLPKIVQQVPRLPLSANQKLDRRALGQLLAPAIAQ